MVDLTCIGEACSITGEYYSWMPNIAILISLIFMILGLGFIFAKITMKKDIEALIRTELYQTIVAVVWITIIATVAFTSCSVSCAFAGGENPFGIASSYIQEIESSMQNSILSLINYAKDLRIKGAITINTGFGLGDIYYRPTSGCTDIAGSLEQVSSVLTTFVGSLIVQKMALSFIYAAAFTVILPIGFVLRLLPFFRETGSMLIAVALAFYIVFPLTYVFADKATASIRSGYGGMMGTGTLCTDIGPVRSALDIVGMGLAQAAFFPALSMIITIGAAKTLSKVFTYDFQDLQ